MRLGHGEAAAADVLGAEDGIVAEALSKVYHDLAERAFEAPTPVITRALRGRRPRGIDEEAVEDDDDGDGDDFGADDVIEAAEPVEATEPEAAVWGLREASFRIPRGAAVALVGGSGSGKTTLLRLLAGAVPPTSGRAVLAGRPSPLINLSVQLMTATQSPAANAALAGNLAGMSKRQVRPLLDDVLTLAEVSERDRRAGVTRAPFKIAVAAAVELASAVLLLDDPFASATGSFRERVLAAVERRQADGATVLIETRDREALRRLCDQAIWLDQGAVLRIGPLNEVLAAYDASAAAARAAAPHPQAAPGFNETAAVVSGAAEAHSDGHVSIALRLEVARTAVTLQTGLGLERADGFGLWFEQPDPVVCELPGFHRFQLVARDVPPGRYAGLIQARVLEGGTEAVIARRNAFEVTVGAPDGEGDGRGPTRWERRDASWLYEPETPGA